MEAVNYLTGQLFNVQKITSIAKAYGIIVGWDLAHAIGNVPLELKNWGVDFAAFCTYKFLNAGPHTTGGIYINELHLIDAYSLKG